MCKPKPGCEFRIKILDIYNFLFQNPNANLNLSKKKKKIKLC